MASYTTVLVGTDGSDSSFLAVDRAAAIAGDAGALLVLVCAYRPLAPRDLDEAAGELGDLAYKVAGSNPAEDVLTEATGRARSAGAARVESVAVQGDAVDALIELASARHAELLVVGNRGLNSLAGRLLGSVPQNVSHRAGCDVLIVHTTGRNR